MKAEELWDRTRCWLECSCGICNECKSQKALIQKGLDEAKVEGYNQIFSKKVVDVNKLKEKVLEIINELKKNNPYPIDIFGAKLNHAWYACCNEAEYKIKETFK